MTTREEMAMHFVSSLLGNSGITSAMGEIKRGATKEAIEILDTEILPRAFALSAVQYADALLEALAQPLTKE